MEKIKFEQFKELFINEAVLQNKDEDYIGEYLAIAKCQICHGVPVIFNVKHLEKICGVRLGYLLAVTNSDRRKFYRKFLLDKNSGGKRPINVPMPVLKLFQNWVLKNILNDIEVSDFAKAYRRGTSLLDNAKFHLEQKLILKLDIKDFFINIRSKSVYEFFLECGYSESVSVLLTRCVTLDGGLPEGAPTSPALSNIIMRIFDKRIGQYCLKKHIRYTRYADDMTFSGDLTRENDLIVKVSEELAYLGLALNKKKTKRLSENNHQIVTGIVVNRKLNTPRIYRKNLRMECYNMLSGYAEHNLSQKIGHHPTNQEMIFYIKHVLGKVNFVLFVNPDIKQFQNYKDQLGFMLDTYEDRV